MTVVNREEVCKALESVYPGTSKKEDIDQSDCFGFKDGEVFTFSGRLSIRVKSGFPREFTGAIRATKMLEHFKNLKTEEVAIEDSKEKLIVKGINEKRTFLKEKKLSLPVKDVDLPKDQWKKLPEDFVDGLKIVQECCETNTSEGATSCIHIHPKWVEACNTFQICKYVLDTGFLESTILSKEVIKRVVDPKAVKFSVSDRWVHFKNASGLVVSCLKSVGIFPDTSEYLDLDEKWVEVRIPKGLGDRISSASISTSENPNDRNYVKITMDGEKGRLRIEGRGETTVYEGSKVIDYKGKSFAFMISPKLLLDVTRKNEKCYLSETKLKINGDKFVYCTCLSRVVEEETSKKKKSK